MLANSSVINGLVMCPFDNREVKISSYDYIRGRFFCDLYSLVRDSWGASRDRRWSFGGRK